MLLLQLPRPVRAPVHAKAVTGCSSQQAAAAVARQGPLMTGFLELLVQPQPAGLPQDLVLALALQLISPQLLAVAVWCSTRVLGQSLSPVGRRGSGLLLVAVLLLWQSLLLSPEAHKLLLEQQLVASGAPAPAELAVLARQRGFLLAV